MLNYCIGGPAFIVDNAYGLTCIGGAGINIQYRAPSDRSLVESVYSSFSREQKYSQQHSIKPTNRSERFRRSTLCWNLLIKLFIQYYNHLRR
jgi:hypothetical protein